MWQVGSSLDKSTEYIPKRSIEKVQEKGCFVAKSSIYVQDVWRGRAGKCPYGGKSMYSMFHQRNDSLRGSAI